MPTAVHVPSPMQCSLECKLSFDEIMARDKGYVYTLQMSQVYLEKTLAMWISNQKHEYKKTNVWIETRCCCRCMVQSMGCFEVLTQVGLDIAIFQK